MSNLLKNLLISLALPSSPSIVTPVHTSVVVHQLPLYLVYVGPFEQFLYAFRPSFVPAFKVLLFMIKECLNLTCDPGLMFSLEGHSL